MLCPTCGTDPRCFRAWDQEHQEPRSLFRSLFCWGFKVLDSGHCFLGVLAVLRFFFVLFLYEYVCDFFVLFCVFLAQEGIESVPAKGITVVAGPSKPGLPLALTATMIRSTRFRDECPWRLPRTGQNRLALRRNWRTRMKRIFHVYALAEET